MSTPGRPTPRHRVAEARGPPPPPKPGPSDKDAVPIQIRAIHDAEDGGKRTITEFANNKVGDDYPWLKKFLLEKGGLVWRAVKVAAILLPLIPSIMLLVFIAKDRNFGGYLNQWFLEDPTDVQVVVSIIVSSITYLNVLTISNLFRAVGIDIKDNFVFKWLLSNVGLAEKGDSGGEDKDSDSGPSEEDVKKWSKFLFGGQWTFKEFVVGILSFALLYAPHVIWMGSLTPSAAGKYLQLMNAPLVPDYTASTEFNWANNDRSGNRSTCFLNFTAIARQPNIGGCAGSAAQSDIYSSIALGTTIMRLDDATEHVSPANANYSYWGRSFGMGSAAGIHVPFDSFEGIPTARNYTERGLFTNVVCKRNASSAFKLTTISNSSLSMGIHQSRIPAIYKTDGQLPDGTSVVAYSIVGDGNGDAVGWATTASDKGFSLFTAVGGSYYNRFNHIQCDIKFVPTDFDVNTYYKTNYSAPIIEVNNLTQVGDFDYAGKDGKLASTAVKQLEIVSRFQSSPYASELGFALDSNLQSWAAGLGLADDFDQDDPMIFDSVADAVSVAIDDILVYVGRAQLSLGASKKVDYLPLVQRVQIGSKPYIYTAMFLTGILFLLGTIRLAYTFFKTRREVRDPENVESKAEYSKLHGPVTQI